MRLGRIIIGSIGAVAVIAAGLALAERHLRRADEPPLAAEARADRILVRKAERSLTLFAGDTPLKSYRVSFGRGHPGPKRVEGDGRTPEGNYSISGRNPRSGYHLSLRVSYPDPQDVAAADALGRPAGGDIMIHGLRNGFGFVGALHRAFDWTEGCVAVTNDEIEEIWRAVPDGAAIEIVP